MKRSLAILLLLLIVSVSITGCKNKVVTIETALNTSSGSNLGVAIDIPSGWSSVSDTNRDTVLVLQNNSDENQFIYISKFRNTSNETNIRLWYEDVGFPNPSPAFEEVIIDGLPALKNPDLDVAYILKENNYYIVQTCLSMQCTPVDKTIFSEVLDSMRFTE